MTLKNNRAPLLCYFKLCAAFRTHWWIQTGVTVRKRPIWVKFCDFSAVSLWNLTDDLEKQLGTSPKQHQAICIISSSYVNSNWSYSPETKIWVVTSVTLTFDLWPWPFAWTLPWSNVITPENFMMIRWWEHSQQGKSEGFESCDWPIVRKRPIWVKIGDILSRVTLKFHGWPWKTTGHLPFAVSSFVQHFIAIGELKLELQSGNAQFGSNSTNFRAMWPWNLTDNLEKQ